MLGIEKERNPRKKKKKAALLSNPNEYKSSSPFPNFPLFTTPREEQRKKVVKSQSFWLYHIVKAKKRQNF